MMPEMIDDVIGLGATALPAGSWKGPGRARRGVPGGACASGRAVALIGEGGLLASMTKTVIEAALDEEVTEHLGHAKSDTGGYNSGNSRCGPRTKTVISGNCGPNEIQVPWDRNGTFEPQLVQKRERRLGDVDAIVLSLSARGLTAGEVSAHFA